MNLEEQFGINLTASIAGLLGGTFSLIYEEKISPLKAIVLIAAGGITAGYAFRAAEHYLNLHQTTTGIVSFGIGLVAMRIIDVFMSIADAAKRNPAILLSLTKLIKTIKNGDTIPNSSPTKLLDSDMESAGTNGKELRENS